MKKLTDKELELIDDNQKTIKKKQSINLLYFNCPVCGNKIKKISKFGDLFTKKNLTCENCKSEFKPSGFFTFWVENFTFLSPVIVIIFAYFGQKILFPNSDKMYLVSYIIGIVLYLIVSIFLTYLIPYKKIKNKEN
ncbi:putative membrane protein [Campylobacter blaseri]|uniref:Uncharacterized protein n=1 Tax=Campylobacter blaseri TaxID=2042961 RepID=A0A2P8R2G0_9BACT|nr:hypothetical protein [Campylobacter blaseri]PSM52671.1 hypothetical protein CQ405_02765 [Campylobacter blaseri]PSM54319.1 hypothetical protein CRN67_02765 [Campylobacter blaseri]QKF85971.1 putative membrane protein [Campylobacter blaseri]